MSETPHTFNESSARRIARVVRDVESNDPAYTGTKRRRKSPGVGRQEYIIGRVTGIDANDATRVAVTEQYWSDDDDAFIDVPGGRVWDGESGNLPTVYAWSGPGIDDIVALGHRYGPDGSAQWFVVPGGSWSFWAKITGNAANGTNKWYYAWTEQARTSSGWSNKTGGRSGTTGSGFALNSCEANNDGTGIQGNSVDIDGGTFTDNPDLAVQPVQGDPVVRMYAEIDTAGGIAYSFEYVNAIDGECA